MKAQRVRVANVKVSRGVVQNVTFVARKKAVTVRTKGLPKIKVQVGDDKSYEALVLHKSFSDVYHGKTPAKAFARAAKGAWA